MAEWATRAGESHPNLVHALQTPLDIGHGSLQVEERANLPRQDTLRNHTHIHTYMWHPDPPTSASFTAGMMFCTIMSTMQFACPPYSRVGARYYHREEKRTGKDGTGHTYMRAYLNLDGSNVLVEHDALSGCALLGRQHAHVAEQLHVLRSLLQTRLGQVR